LFTLGKKFLFDGYYSFPVPVELRQMLPTEKKLQVVGLLEEREEKGPRKCATEPIKDLQTKPRKKVAFNHLGHNKSKPYL
jgi:hypothetical protein